MSKEELEWAEDGNEEVSVEKSYKGQTTLYGGPYGEICVRAWEEATGEKLEPGGIVQVDDVDNPTKIKVGKRWIKLVE